jgi:hydrogenase expression/formation protein HypE
VSDNGDNGGKVSMEGPACPVPVTHSKRIVLGHGSGGKLTGDLIRDLFLPVLSNPWLEAADDSAVVSTDLLQGASNLAVSTDAHVVHPLFFPGGDIGCLSVNGTVNDVAMVGAVPIWISAAFIIEEGFPIADLERIVRSMQAAAAEAGVVVVAGDTKVTEKGKVDGLYITTTGVGRIPSGRNCGPGNIRVGDAVLLSGTLGDHGIAVLAARGDLAFRTDIKSDTAPLTGMVEAMFASGAEIHALRDPTRGGLAASLNELAEKSGVAVVLEEGLLPIRPEVEAASEMLGFDPLHIANEGKLVAFVPEEDTESVLAAMRQSPHGRDACRIGRVGEKLRGRVLMETSIGGKRIVDIPAGELLPRIC